MKIIIFVLDYLSVLVYTKTIILFTSVSVAGGRYSCTSYTMVTLFIPDYPLPEWLLQIQQAWYSQVFLKKRVCKFRVLTDKLYIQGCHWHFKLLGIYIYSIFEGRESFLFPMKVARNNIHRRQWKSLFPRPLLFKWLCLSLLCRFIISIQGCP